MSWSDDETCQQCGASVRPSLHVAVRRPDPLDLIGRDESRVGDAGPIELAAQAIHRLTRVTREKATTLLGESLRTNSRDTASKAIELRRPSPRCLKVNSARHSSLWSTISKREASRYTGFATSSADSVAGNRGFVVYFRRRRWML